MDIESVRHKQLRAFLETGVPKAIDARLVGRLRNMIAFLNAAHNVEELKVPPNFGFHFLEGEREGTASITLTKNWQMTFKVNAANEIIELDLEDYH